MKTLKIRLNNESEALLQSNGVSLDEFAILLVFGHRRRSGAGVEILFDVLPPECEKEEEFAERLRSLLGLSLLIVNGRVRECRRMVNVAPKLQGETNVLSANEQYDE